MLECERAQPVPQLSHRGRSTHPFPDDVADDETEESPLELDDVVPVAPDVDAYRSGQVAGRDLDVVELGQAAWEHAALQRFGDGPLGLEPGGTVECLRALARERDDPLALLGRKVGWLCEREAESSG